MIKSKKAKEYVAKFWYEQPNKQALQMAYMAGFTEAEERHANELQAVKDKAVETYKSMCDYRREDGTCYSACSNYNLCCNQCESVEIFTQKINKNQ